MNLSDDFLAGWSAARRHAQASGSVPPAPPGYVPTAAETPEPPSTPDPDPVADVPGEDGETDEEAETS